MTVAATVSRCSAAVTFGSEGEVHVVAGGTSPVVGTLLLPTAAIVSEPPLFASALASASVSSVVSEASLVPVALASVVSTVPITALTASIFSLFLGANGDRHADQGLHVQGTIDVSNMSEWMVGAANHAVDFSDVGPIVCTDHDGVQGRGGTIKMHEQATLVAFRLYGTSKHHKTCSILRPSAFGVVGISPASFVGGAGLHRALTPWPRTRWKAGLRYHRQPLAERSQVVLQQQGLECRRRVVCWLRTRQPP